MALRLISGDVSPSIPGNAKTGTLFADKTNQIFHAIEVFSLASLDVFDTAAPLRILVLHLPGLFPNADKEGHIPSLLKRHAFSPFHGK